jgi:hypothetical protein
MSPGGAEQTFFDSLDRKKLKEMLGVRVADGSLLRLIGKRLHVGVLDGVEARRQKLPCYGVQGNSPDCA